MNGSDPGYGSFAITPSDANNLPRLARSVRVSTGGNVHFMGEDGEEDTWTCPDFDVIPVMIRKVFATGTTATGLHGIW